MPNGNKMTTIELKSHLKSKKEVPDLFEPDCTYIKCVKYHNKNCWALVICHSTKKNTWTNRYNKYAEISLQVHQLQPK
jgi:hypothetical protein